MKRAHYGIYHFRSKEHLHRYINEITRRPEMAELPAFADRDGSGITMIRGMVAGMTRKRLTYRELSK